MSKIYDFRIPIEDMNQITKQIDSMKDREIVKLKEPIEGIKQSSESNRLESARSFFDTTIQPALIDFAEMTSSLLMIQECDNQNVIITTIVNNGGVDITESCKAMRGILVMANCISLGSEDEEPALSLIFNLIDLIS